MAADSTSIMENRVETEDVSSAWGVFADFLLANGQRVTHTRKIIVDHVMRRTDHFCADEVAASLASGRSRVSRATVYNTLSLMLRAGLVRGIRDNDVHMHYEVALGSSHHAHMICDRCGKFIEFTPDGVCDAVYKSCKTENFTSRSHSLVVFGYCEDCAQLIEREK